MLFPIEFFYYLYDPKSFYVLWVCVFMILKIFVYDVMTIYLYNWIIYIYIQNESSIIFSDQK